MIEDARSFKVAEFNSRNLSQPRPSNLNSSPLKMGTSQIKGNLFPSSFSADYFSQRDVLITLGGTRNNSSDHGIWFAWILIADIKEGTCKNEECNFQEN